MCLGSCRRHRAAEPVLGRRPLDRSGAPDESGLAGAREGDLTEIFGEAGFRDVEELPLAVSVEHESFDEWWEPFTFGVGPAGGYVAGLGEPERRELRERCRGELGAGPFVSRRAPGPRTV